MIHIIITIDPHPRVTLHEHRTGEITATELAIQGVLAKALPPHIKHVARIFDAAYTELPYPPKKGKR
jgi:hypothetical protein